MSQSLLRAARHGPRPKPAFARVLRAASLAVLTAALLACGSADDSLVPADAMPVAPGVPGGSTTTVPVPLVIGPIGTAGLRGHALWDSWHDLTELGYTEDEYFISGTAKSFADPAVTAPYTTRIIVRRPIDPTRFNGTVLLDWVNVTAQFENAVDTVEAHQLFHREGFAYVHVSAQSAGVCCIPLTPKTWDPVRYMALSHPGDDFAFDMFSQIGQALRMPPAIDPMAGLPVRRLIAMGQSQSGTRMRDYLIHVQPQTRMFDAFLVHADGSGVKSYPADPAAPTIQLLSEREATPDAPNVSRNYRLWEIAGAAHQDFWIGVHSVQGHGPRVLADMAQRPASADADLHASAGNYGEQYDPGQGVCIVEGAQFPLRYAVMAAIHHLDRWIRSGVPPPQGARFQFDSAGRLARDGNANALGGIRLPPIEVPVASYRSADCNLGGITVPFTEVQLQQLYPTHADYYCKMQAATQKSIADGFLLPEDAVDLMDRVEAAKGRFLSAGTPGC